MKRKFSQDKSEEDPRQQKDRSSVEVNVRKRINFDEDSDEEVIIDTQAHKRRKLAGDMEELKVWMEKQFDTRLSNLATRDQQQQLIDTVNKNAERSKKNELDIGQIQTSMMNMEQRLASSATNSGSSTYSGVLMQQQRTSSLKNPSNIVQDGRGKTSNSEERAAFLLSRRSLRFWPIEGENPDALMEATIDFCCGALGARRSTLGIKKVTRVKSAPRGVAFLEVLVEFADNYSRDELLMQGPMLMQYRDAKNKPTAGIRLDIPAHLMGSFKTLEAYGVDLKRQHKWKLRKYIKFDETEEDLYLQIKHDDDESWLTFSPAEAKRELNSKNTSKQKTWNPPPRK